jgi:hypothetical protein
MIIDETRMILFIHIPKSAGDSIRDVLCNYGNNGKHFLGKHANYRMAEEALGEQIAFYTTFSVIRNPYDRLLSFYHHLRKPLDLSWTQLQADYPSFNGKLLPEWACDIAMQRSFPDFIKEIYSEKHRESPQRRWFADSLEWLTNSDGRLATNTILRFENLRNEFDDFCCSQAINGRLPWLGESNSPKSVSGYRQWYDPESTEIVSTVFAACLEQYGYTF